MWGVWRGQPLFELPPHFDDKLLQFCIYFKHEWYNVSSRSERVGRNRGILMSLTFSSARIWGRATIIAHILIIEFNALRRIHG